MNFALEDGGSPRRDVGRGETAVWRTVWKMTRSYALNVAVFKILH